MRRSGLTFINLFQYWFRFIYCSYYITWPRDHWPVPTITCTPCSSKVGPDASNHNLNVCKITKLLWQRIGCWLWRAGSPELSALTEVIILGVIPKYSASSILKYTSIFKKHYVQNKVQLGMAAGILKKFFLTERYMCGLEGIGGGVLPSGRESYSHGIGSAFRVN